MGKKIMIIILLFLIIGFAAINTTLYVESNTKVAFNTDDFKVYFSSVYIEDEDYTNLLLNEERTTITFTTEKIEHTGSNFGMTYDIANVSTQYDAVVSVKCSSSNSEVSITNYAENIFIKSREIKMGSTYITTTNTVSEPIVVTCLLETIPSEKTTRNESSLELSDTYVISGTYVDSSENPIPNANLVIFSEIPHYVLTDENGYLFYNGLEKGEHEIYYVNDTLENIKNKTKDQIINSSVSSAIFTTTTATDITFGNSSRITNKILMGTSAFCRTQLGNSFNYTYTGSYQKFMSLCDGVYNIELWGASGGLEIDSGYGGYVSGEIELKNGENLYVYVGSHGTQLDPSAEIMGAGWNGGGNASNTGHSSGYEQYGGGGATDIRYFGMDIPSISDLSWDSTIGLASRIMVASGGGGLSESDNTQKHGGNGGGLIGEKGLIYSSGGPGTQISGGSGYVGTNYGTGGAGSFGKGGQGNNYAPGGGGGYYGGAGGTRDITDGEGGGGSSFISGHNGCIAIHSSSLITPRKDINGNTCIASTSDITCSKHYSGLYFKNTKMIDGSGYQWTTEKGNEVVGMPSQDGTTTMTGNLGNGYAKITLVSLK